MDLTGFLFFEMSADYFSGRLGECHVIYMANNRRFLTYTDVAGVSGFGETG